MVTAQPLLMQDRNLRTVQGKVPFLKGSTILNRFNLLRNSLPLLSRILDVDPQLSEVEGNQTEVPITLPLGNS